MAYKKQVKAFDIGDALRELTSGLKVQATRPNIHGYIPHAKQAIFHKSTCKRKLYIGGNRSGKTTAAIIEAIHWLSGKHPNRPLPEGQIRGRIVGVSFLDGVQKILIPEFKRWCPLNLLKNGNWDDSYSRELRTLTLTNGNTVEFMSYDQDTNKFAGTSRHFIYYDEEPPQHIFNECNARLVDTAGSWWIAMTPVEGMTWVFDRIYQPGTTDQKDSILVIEADMLDNPYITPEAAEAYLSGLDKDERAAREHGRFVQLGGLVFKSFSKEIHVIEPIVPPKSWEWYISLDHGFNNPTAVLWHAVSPVGKVITFAEHYQSEMVISDHASKIISVNTAFGRIPDIWVADPALAQRQGVTGASIFGEYADHGCFFAPGNNDVQVGVTRMSQYLRLGHSDNLPSWTITENCPNLIKEMGLLRWQTYESRKTQYANNKRESIHKKDDHAADSARYFFTFLPDLTPQLFGSSVSEGDTFRLPSVAGTSPAGTIDEYLKGLATPDSAKTQWKNTLGSDLGALEYE